MNFSISLLYISNIAGYFTCHDGGLSIEQWQIMLFVKKKIVRNFNRVNGTS